MNNNYLPENDRQFVTNSLEAAVRIGLVAILAFWCFDIVKPFITAIIWGVIIAVAIYPLYQRLLTVLGGRHGLASGLCTVVFLIILILPTILLASTLIESIEFLIQGLSNNTLQVPPPPENISSWPFIGAPLAKFWELASDNLGAALSQIAPHLTIIGNWLLLNAKGTGLGILQFMVAIIISGFLLAKSKSGQQFTLLIVTRFAGERRRGEKIMDLTYATVHSVALGILGVAIIQSILAGLGFIVAGVPAAGLWALLCLILAVLQIGIALVTTPIVIYMLYSADTVTAVALLIWCVPVTFIDTILKPILLSRGVNTPMVVIFLGAIGGFIESGIVGLFIGAVIFSLGYALFMSWVKEEWRDDKM
ncbi:AI-2E family transporter [Methyloprofundus sp.]|uniref:AI-2E family transporter n=1 Tax=Methyloprofundus sp. TaxID=2020875 RepID=UPI003D098B48